MLTHAHFVQTYDKAVVGSSIMPGIILLPRRCATLLELRTAGVAISGTTDVNGTTISLSRCSAISTAY